MKAVNLKIDRAEIAVLVLSALVLGSSSWNLHVLAEQIRQGTTVEECR